MDTSKVVLGTGLGIFGIGLLAASFATYSVVSRFDQVPATVEKANQLVTEVKATADQIKKTQQEMGEKFDALVARLPDLSSKAGGAAGEALKSFGEKVGCPDGQENCDPNNAGAKAIDLMKNGLDRFKKPPAAPATPGQPQP